MKAGDFLQVSSGRKLLGTEFSGSEYVRSELKWFRTECNMEDRNMECSKSDWKYFRSKIAEWQEAYMEQLTKEYIQLLSSSEKASDKFWELEERIKKDRKHPGVIIELNKENMLYDIVALINYKVITVEDLDGFSDDLKEKVNFFLKR